MRTRSGAEPASHNEPLLITRGQTIDGLDAVEIRDQLRPVMRYAFTREGFAQLIDRAGARDPAVWFEMLERHGLIASGGEVHAGPVVHGDGEDVRDAVLWQTTVAGNALAKARIGRPMPRSRAEALLNRVVAGAQEVNSNPGQMFWVDVVELFGSLTRADAATVGDVDLRVQFSHRYTGDALVGEIERRRPGRSLLDAVVVASAELHRHLTGGSRKIDLQLDETISRPLPDGTEPLTVYTRQ